MGRSTNMTLVCVFVVYFDRCLVIWLFPVRECARKLDKGVRVQMNLIQSNPRAPQCNYPVVRRILAVLDLFKLLSTQVVKYSVSPCATSNLDCRARLCRHWQEIVPAKLSERYSQMGKSCFGPTSTFSSPLSLSLSNGWMVGKTTRCAIEQFFFLPVSRIHIAAVICLNPQSIV